jgi:hypothetical protein
MTEQRKDKLLLTTFLAFVMIVFMVFMLAHAAWAHQNYPSNCCEDRHCRPVACEEIASDGDYWIWHGSRIEKTKAMPSQDGGCHVCITEKGVMLCIFLGGTS